MKTKNNLLTIGMLIGTLILGVAGGSLIKTLAANAASTTTAAATTATSTVDQANPQPVQVDQTKGGHVGTNGVKEVLLTGTTAEKVKAAALAAVPGGTILRVETDADVKSRGDNVALREGAAYEAHMTKSDGSQVTVKLDTSFKVTSTEAGMGVHP